MTLRDELNDAILYGEAKLAYTIYWASQNGASLDSTYESMNLSSINFEEVDKLVQADPLGINSIKLYTSKTKGGLFHLVLATSENEARQEIHKHDKERIMKVSDVSHGMDQVLWNDDTRKSEYIRQTKMSAVRFPHYVGLIEKE